MHKLSSLALIVPLTATLFLTGCGADNDTASQARSQFPAAQSVGSNGSFDSDKDADHSLVQASEQAGPKPTLAAKAASGGTTKNAASSMDTSSSGNLYPNGGCYRLH